MKLLMKHEDLAIQQEHLRMIELAKWVIILLFILLRVLGQFANGILLQKSYINDTCPPKGCEQLSNLAHGLAVCRIGIELIPCAVFSVALISIRNKLILKNNPSTTYMLF